MVVRMTLRVSAAPRVMSLAMGAFGESLRSCQYCSGVQRQSYSLLLDGSSDTCTFALNRDGGIFESP